MHNSIQTILPLTSLYLLHRIVKKVAQCAMIMRADAYIHSTLKLISLADTNITGNLLNHFIIRSEDEIDQVAHGRWGKNEESDVSDAPITGNSDSESESRSDSRSDRSRTPSRSPTPRRDLDERSQSQASFADGIETGTLVEEKLDSTPKEDPRDKLPPYLPSVYGCRSVEEFQVITNTIGL